MSNYLVRLESIRSGEEKESAYLVRKVHSATASVYERSKTDSEINESCISYYSSLGLHLPPNDLLFTHTHAFSLGVSFALAGTFTYYATGSAITTAHIIICKIKQLLSP